MDTIKIAIVGDRRAGIRFDEFPDHLYDALRGEINALTEELFSRVRAATPVDTGRLRSQERMRLFADKDRITGYIDIAGESSSRDFGKAGALEYGAKRPAKVSAHSMQLDHYWADKLAAPEKVLVAAYVRPTNIATFAFERGPLGAMAPEIIARLNAVIEKTVADANA